MDYQGNSDKIKDAKGEKQIVKVVTGEVVVKPESLGRKFRHVFFGGDLRTSLNYVGADVMLPMLRRLIADSISGAVDGVLFGDNFRRRPPENRPRTVYNNPVTRSYRAEPRSRGYLPDQPKPYRGQDKVDLREIVLKRREDAEAVVEQLILIVDKYESASLVDLHDLLGEPSSYTDERWGWTALGRVDIRQTRDGYIIDLPPLEVI